MVGGGDVVSVFSVLGRYLGRYGRERLPLASSGEGAGRWRLGVCSEIKMTCCMMWVLVPPLAFESVFLFLQCLLAGVLV